MLVDLLGTPELLALHERVKSTVKLSDYFSEVIAASEEYPTTVSASAHKNTVRAFFLPTAPAVPGGYAERYRCILQRP
jgi:hypothetical protein